MSNLYRKHNLFTLFKIIGFSLLFNGICVAGYKTNAITDPGISKRCQQLVQKRNSKITHKQKITALLKRNRILSKRLPPNKASIFKKLKGNYIKLEKELLLAGHTIFRMDEDIVRKGCPGISL